MIRYTVTYSDSALQALAREWTKSSDRQAITVAGDEIDRQLLFDAPAKGDWVREGLRRLIVHPLQVQFSVDENDRKVTIWSVNVINNPSEDA
jgi:hypothetical protein